MKGTAGVAIAAMAGLINGVVSGALAAWVGGLVSKNVVGMPGEVLGAALSVVLALVLFFAIGNMLGSNTGNTAYVIAGTIALVSSGALSAMITRTDAFIAWIKKQVRTYNPVGGDDVVPSSSSGSTSY